MFPVSPLCIHNMAELSLSDMPVPLALEQQYCDLLPIAVPLLELQLPELEDKGIGLSTLC
jgi:hypothetical protein